MNNLVQKHFVRHIFAADFDKRMLATALEEKMLHKTVVPKLIPHNC